MNSQPSNVTPFEQRAQILMARNIPVAPLPPMMKFAPPKEWEKLATTDTVKLAAMNPHPDGNTAAVARAEVGGTCFFEIDKPNFHTTIQEQTGQKFPETLMVSSSGAGKGRGHIYLRHTAASIALGNCQAKDSQGEIWSFRASNRYCVGPLSVHPNGATYEITKDAPIADCPDWLVSWMAANKNEDKKAAAELNDESPIVMGARNQTLTSILGRARETTGADYDVLLALARQHNQNCVPQLSDQELQTIARSISKYPKGKLAGPVIYGGVPLGQPQVQTVEQIEIPKLNKIAYPVFPSWVMAGTSIYEGFVKPVCDQNSRVPYFMFLPAAALMLNYIGTKVRVEHRSLIPSFFIVLIGEKDAPSSPVLSKMRLSICMLPE